MLHHAAVLKHFSILHVLSKVVLVVFGAVGAKIIAMHAVEPGAHYSIQHSTPPWIRRKSLQTRPRTPQTVELPPHRPYKVAAENATVRIVDAQIIFFIPHVPLKIALKAPGAEQAKKIAMSATVSGVETTVSDCLF